MASAAGYSRTLDALYAACQSPALWPDALTTAADYVGALGGFVVRNPPAGQVGTIVSGRLCEELSRSYIASYSDNLWTRAIRDAGRAGPIIASSLVPERELVRTACYADIVRPHGAIDMAILGVDALSGHGSVGGYGFPLSRRQADDSGVARRLGRLSPHLQRALVLSLHTADANVERNRPLSAVLERMGTGAVVLDATAGVLLANVAAERVFARSRILRIGADKRLAASTAPDTARLETAIRAALTDTDMHGNDHVVRLTGPVPNGALTLLVSPLPRQAFVMARSLETASVMVLMLGGDEAVAMEAATRSTFGLSAAEARVAGLIASGKDRPEVAQFLGISVETVKKHLQQCFAKTGTHNQAEMTRLALHLSQRGD